MPIHDWTRAQAGLFHEFHQSWTVRIKDALNGGGMPKGYYALVEQKVDGPEPARSYFFFSSSCFLYCSRSAASPFPLTGMPVS